MLTDGLDLVELSLCSLHHLSTFPSIGAIRTVKRLGGGTTLRQIMVRRYGDFVGHVDIPRRFRRQIPVVVCCFVGCQMFPLVECVKG